MAINHTYMNLFVNRQLNEVVTRGHTLNDKAPDSFTGFHKDTDTITNQFEGCSCLLRYVRSSHSATTPRDDIQNRAIGTTGFAENQNITAK